MPLGHFDLWRKALVVIDSVSVATLGREHDARGQTNRALRVGFTFSSSWRSCLVRASLEHMVCWGATTVHTHLPSLSWAELYTCQDSSGLAGKTWQWEILQHLNFIVSFIIPDLLALQTHDTRLPIIPSACHIRPRPLPTHQSKRSGFTSVSFTCTVLQSIWLTAVRERRSILLSCVILELL